MLPSLTCIFVWSVLIQKVDSLYLLVFVKRALISETVCTLFVVEGDAQVKDRSIRPAL